jgi:hypothetical protein
VTHFGQGEGGRRLAALVAVAFAGVALALVAAAGPAAARVPASTPGTAPTSVILPGQAGAARDFWTPARMRAAVPLAGPEPPPSASAATAPATNPLSTSETLPDPTLPGLAVNGAIFIREGEPGRSGFGRCSGTSVVAPNMSVVITAGHCVYDEGEWSKDKWVFVPGYHHGERPFGTFAAHWLGTTPAWLAGEDSNFDVGAAVVGRNEKGQRLAAAVGADRIAFGQPPGQLFDVYGYPVEKPFNGGTLQVCRNAPYEGHDFNSFLEPGPLDLAVRCDDSAGGSGGGWVIGGNVLNGVTSYGYPEDPSTNFGPYFGGAVAKLYHQAGAVK